MGFTSGITNQIGTPAMLQTIFAALPTSALLGTLAVTTDTLKFYRFNGTAWVEISGSGGAGWVDGGNSFGANASIGTNDNFRVAFKSNNVDRMYLFNSGNFAWGTNTDILGLNFHVNGLGRFARLSVGGAIISNGLFDVITSGTDAYAVGVRNTTSNGFTRLLFARDNTGSGTYAPFFIGWTNTGHPSPNLALITNESGAIRFTATTELQYFIAATQTMRVALGTGNRPNVAINGAPIDGAYLALLGADGMFMPPVMTGTQANAISPKPPVGIIYATSSDGAITSPGFWGWNGTTFVLLG